MFGSLDIRFSIAYVLVTCYNKYPGSQTDMKRQQPMSADQLDQHCNAVVRRLIERHGWSLIDEADFSARVLARAQSEDVAPDGDAIKSLAINLYCEELYDACCSAGQRREQAYSELARYLYDRANYKYGDPEMARVITHDAIILLSEQLDNCRKPGAFLAFAMLKLWNAATTYFRKRDRRQERTESLPEEHPEERSSVYARPTSETPEATVIDAAMSEALLARLEEIFCEAPRARRQLRAVFLKFLYGHSDGEIADALDTKVSNVYVLRSRGLKRLRADPALRQLADDVLGKMP